MSRIKKLPVILEHEEAEALLRIPNKKYLPGLRNRAIIALMLNMGLRVSEVVNLKPGNDNLTKSKIRIVSGKGGIDRDLSIPLNTSEYLKAWKDTKPPGTEYFFCIVKKVPEGYFETKIGNKLTVRGIQVWIKRYAVRAGITKNVSPHTLRHTYATMFYKQTKDLETLRMILGHSDISTTQIYITLANIDVENGIQLFNEINLKKRK